MYVRGFKIPMVWNWLQTLLVFKKHCPQLQLGWAVPALRAVPWTSTGRREGRGSLWVSLASPGSQWNLISLALESLVPFAVGWGLWQLFVEASFGDVMYHLGPAVLFKPGSSLPLRPQQSFSWGVRKAECSCLLSPGLFCVQLLEWVWRTPRGAHFSILQSMTLWKWLGGCSKVWELWDSREVPTLHYMCILWSQGCTSIHLIFELISNNRYLSIIYSDHIWTRLSGKLSYFLFVLVKLSVWFSMLPSPVFWIISFRLTRN